MAAPASETRDADVPEPRANPDLIGHADAERTLMASLASGRLPHAWLIGGPRGIGKATLAYRFVRYLFQNPPGAGAGAGGLFDAGDIPAAPAADGLYVTPESPVFRRVAAAGHSDLMTVELTVNDSGKLATQIRVDDVRAAIDFARLTAGEGGMKAIVVDGAEWMNRESENAFLKILEEPPGDTVILMVSHNPGRLLPTTRSRCRMLALKPLATATVTTLLNRYRPDLDPAAADELARLSEGSIGRALALAEGDGLEVYRDLVNMLRDLPALDGTRVQAFAAKLSRPGNDDAYRAALDLYRWWLARVVLAASRGADADASLTADERALAARVQATAPLPVWLERLDAAESLIRSADPLSLDRKRVLMSLLYKFAG